jgi:hypothetical protein
LTKDPKRWRGIKFLNDKIIELEFNETTTTPGTTDGPIIDEAMRKEEGEGDEVIGANEQEDDKKSHHS